MKFYVAGKYSERFMIRRVFDELKQMGHEITVDWTNHDIYPNDAESKQLASFAQDDVKGIKDCDIFIACLLNKHEYKGLWCEMGCALALNKPVLVAGHAGDSCIFINHPLVKKFESFPKLYEFLSQV